MLTFNMGFFVFYLLIPTLYAVNVSTDDLYLKFHQNDYDFQFEWAEVVSVKQPEVKTIKWYMFKFNRTCPAVNVSIGFNIDIGNELEVIMQAYKFASNEYRLFPLRLQVNFCKAFNVNAMGIARAKNCGNFKGCPVLKGVTYHVCNWTPDQSQFPPLIPVGRYMLEFQGLFREKELYVLRGYGEISRSILKY